MNGIVLCAVLMAGAPALKGRLAVDPLVGEWVLEGAIVRGGLSVPPLVAVRYTFRTDGRYVVRKGDEESTEAYTADREAKPAPAIDLGARRGVYRVDGDRLTICVAAADDTPRPQSVEPPDLSKYAVLLFTRGKRKKKDRRSMGSKGPPNRTVHLTRAATSVNLETRHRARPVQVT
jgi:uncharacterized protein (TIGR03067 family)